MNQNEFVRQQQAAVERMREMNSRAQINRNTNHKMPPVPPFVRVGENKADSINLQASATTEQTPSENHSKQAPTPAISSINPSFNGLNIPFIDKLLKDGDSTLIIGLLLILMSENSDKLLLFALVYILL